MFKPLYFIFFKALLRPYMGFFCYSASLEIQDFCKTKRTATAYPKVTYHSSLRITYRENCDLYSSTTQSLMPD